MKLLGDNPRLTTTDKALADYLVEQLRQVLAEDRAERQKAA